MFGVLLQLYVSLFSYWSFNPVNNPVKRKCNPVIMTHIIKPAQNLKKDDFDRCKCDVSLMFCLTLGTKNLVIVK